MALVAMPATPIANGQVSTSVVTTTTTQFTRDLTIGATGADVIALQTWLISQGFTIPAGATGYFGAQTKAALARYQASAGITPAAGYFGPITRARVAVQTPAPSNPNQPQQPDTLQGGEAQLRDFDLKREESEGEEGEEGVEVATASFDVERGDVRIERMEIIVRAENGSLSNQPWRYFERIAIVADGEEIADADTDSRADWSRSGSDYRLTLTGIRHTVRSGDTAELTIVADVAPSIKSDALAQRFGVSVPDRGIRAVDARGLQQYVGNTSDTISFGFAQESSGELRLATNKDNPESSILVADRSRESKEFDVLVFDLRNRDAADVELNELTVRVTDLNSGVLASEVIRRATLTIGRDSFSGTVGTSTIRFDDMETEIDGDDEETATLSVRLARNATSTPIAFSVAAADIDAEGIRSGDASDISGSVQSRVHTIAFAGVQVRSATTNAAVAITNPVENSYGTFTIRFDVTAVEEDAYIATTTAESGNVGVRYSVNGSSFTGVSTAVLSSTARQENGFFLVREGRTESMTLTVTLNPDAAGTFFVQLDSVGFATSESDTDRTYFMVGTNGGFRTDPLYIPE